MQKFSRSAFTCSPGNKTKRVVLLQVYARGSCVLPTLETKRRTIRSNGLINRDWYCDASFGRFLPQCSTLKSLVISVCSVSWVVCGIDRQNTCVWGRRSVVLLVCCLVYTFETTLFRRNAGKMQCVFRTRGLCLTRIQEVWWTSTWVEPP